MGNRQWYIVIKYSRGNYIGERFDAHYVETSAEALEKASRRPSNPLEMFRGYWVRNEQERKEAINLHGERLLADRDWMVLMDRIESQWEKVGIIR